MIVIELSEAGATMVVAVRVVVVAEVASSR